MLAGLLDVFVAAPGTVADDDLVFVHGGGDFGNVGDGVGGLEEGDDAFDSAEFLEGFEGCSAAQPSMVRLKRS